MIRGVAFSWDNQVPGPLPVTKDRFRLNQKFPNPLNQGSGMEVDFDGPAA